MRNEKKKKKDHVIKYVDIIVWDHLKDLITFQFISNIWRGLV